MLIPVAIAISVFVAVFAAATVRHHLRLREVAQWLPIKSEAELSLADL